MKDLALLQNTYLFRGMTQEEIQQRLPRYDPKESFYQKGEFLRHAGDPMSRFGLVLEGTVMVFRSDYNGNRMMLSTVTAGGSFGEPSYFLDAEECGVYVIAACDTRVLWIKVNIEGMKMCTDQLCLRLITQLARRNIGMNDRIQILSKTTAREKLMIYFSLCAEKYGSRNFTIPLDRNALAEYLAVNRSVLSRELSRMEQEGLIEYHKNSFRLL